MKKYKLLESYYVMENDKMRLVDVDVQLNELLLDPYIDILDVKFNTTNYESETKHSVLVYYMEFPPPIEF